MQLISSLKENRDRNYPFHMPGHKRQLAGDELLEGIYGIDITEIEGADNLHNASGIIKEAQDRAAELYGADETHFLVNGSTGGLLAAIYATVTEGDSIVIAENCHKSVYDAVMLSGARLCLIMPEKEELFDIYGGITPESVQEALSQIDAEGGERTRRAVVITSPTYEGITSDIGSIARICHGNDAVLIVDAAHGAHLGFSDAFPKSAIAEGADVVITGIHKTMPAMTQTSLIHINGNCPSKERIRKMLSVFSTSSPSYVLMASIDSMTDLVSRRKEELFAAYDERLNDFYEKAEELECLSVLRRENLTAAGSYDHDKGKIVIKDMTGTYSGKELFKVLCDEYGIMPEMASDEHVLLMTAIADTDEGFRKLEDALSAIDAHLSGQKIAPKARGFIKRIYDRTIGKIAAAAVMKAMPEENGSSDRNSIRFCEGSMKAALFEDNAELIPPELAEGRIAKDTVIIYPPGTPVTVPGCRIDGGAVDRILQAGKNGLEVIGLKDGEIAVLWEKSSI